MDTKHLDKVLKLPLKQRLALLVIVLLLEGAGLFFGLVQPKLKQLQEVQKKLDDIHTKVEESRRIAMNIGKYRNDYDQLKKDLDAALTELPNQKEIPSLLTSISSAGKGAGLDFLMFRPLAEEPKDFYAVVPVDIAVSGSFYNVANFFVSVSNLPRIVNIKNVVVSEIREEQGRSKLKINCLATTFRFLEKKETSDGKKAPAPQ
jgi:type IV pilus assembly protein PilO